MPKRSTAFLEQQRSDILDAARCCFTREGYDRATIRTIAAEAGLSTGAIYTYFQTKAEMLLAICQAQAAAQQLALAQALAASADAPLDVAALLATALAPFLALPQAQVRERELIDMLFWYEATREPELGALMRDLLAGWQQAVRVQLQREQQAGRIIAPFDLEALAAVLVGMPFGMLLYDVLRDAHFDRTAWVSTAGMLLQQGLFGSETGQS